MTSANRTISAGRPAVFVQQLHRAAAQRGRLDPVYQDLSDHWTQVLQRLYPVWALIGPGLSDPGHVEIHSRTVYLDSEALLGSRAVIAAGTLERRAVLRCFGVALHETLHAKHTKRWAIEHDIELSESDDPAGRQLADALEQAIATARAGQLTQLDEDVDLGQVLEHAAASGERSSELGRGRGTGLPTGRLPDRGVDRLPYPDEVKHARRYATRLRQAITQGTRQVDKRTPGGRFDGRAYARGRAEQAAGRPVTTHPWRVTRQVAAPIQEPHVGLIIDTSGSMASYEYALGPIAWILTDGLR
jgi:hypothetical protein